MRTEQINHSRLSSSNFYQLIKCFAIDMSATQTAKLLCINRNTVNRYFNEIRTTIASHYVNNVMFTDSICEVDESYFGAKRARGRAGRGALVKVIVFGIIQRNGLVYTEVVSDTKADTLIPIIQLHCAPSCVIYSDECRSYASLKKLGYIHKRIKHSSNIFVEGTVHTNTIESYWSYCKSRLSKFHGMNKAKFHQHTKECEYRFNHRKEDIYKSLIKLLSDHPLFSK